MAGAEFGAVDGARGGAHRALLDVLAGLIRAGGVVPCMGGPGWTRGAAAEQNAAALACGRCPALAECWQYQHEYPESAGAHAGLTDSERKAKQ
ncbi:hypothetical protein RCH21_002512 [Arthrobacter sp. PL16]|nr:hypothetical protein [Arthrobacter sp. PL16]